MFDAVLSRPDPEALPRAVGAVAVVLSIVATLILAWIFSRFIRYLLWWVMYLFVGGPTPDWAALETISMVEIELVPEEIPEPEPRDEPVHGAEPADLLGDEPPPPGPTMAERAASVEARGEMFLEATLSQRGSLALLASLMVTEDVMVQGGVYGRLPARADEGMEAVLGGSGELGALIGTGGALGSGGLGMRGGGMGGGGAVSGGIGLIGTGSGGSGFGSLGGGGVATGLAGRGTVGGPRVYRKVTDDLKAGDTDQCTGEVTEKGKIRLDMCRPSLHDAAEAAVRAGSLEAGPFVVKLRGPAPTESRE